MTPPLTRTAALCHTARNRTILLPLPPEGPDPSRSPPRHLPATYHHSPVSSNLPAGTLALASPAPLPPCPLVAEDEHPFHSAQALLGSSHSATTPLHHASPPVCNAITPPHHSIMSSRITPSRHETMCWSPPHRSGLGTMGPQGHGAVWVEVRELPVGVTCINLRGGE